MGRTIDTSQRDAAGRETAGALDHLFRVRSRVIAGFAVAVAVVADLGEERWLIVAALAVGVLPYNLLLEQRTRRTGAVPSYVPWLDQVFALAAVVILPELWPAVLLVMVASLALAATAFRLRLVAPPAFVSAVAVAIVGAVTQEPLPAIVGSVGFAGGVTLAVVPIAVVTAHRIALETENRDLVENIDAIVWSLVEDERVYRSMSPAAARVLGYPLDRLLDVDFWLGCVDPDDRDAVASTRARVLRTGEAADVDYRITAGSGDRHWFREVLNAERGTSTTPGIIRGVTVDITARRVAEEERALYAEVVEHITTALVVGRIDRAGDGDLQVAGANPAAGRLFGTSPSKLTGVPLDDLLRPADDTLAARLRTVAEAGGSFTLERIEGLGIDRQKTFSVDAFPLPDRAVGLAMADVTEAAMVAAALRRQALHDGLTGLPNRTLLRDRLQYALADARRRDERVALILLDLNHFKEVNDALGHQYGDRLLVAFARRLQALLRECDTIARLGGDEFALLLTHATNEGASRVVTKVTSAMQEPFELDGVTVQTTASLGVALFPDHAEDADLLTQRADVAMYNAKRGGGGWAIYSPAQDQSSVERLTLLSALHTELDDAQPKELTLHYQPILDLHTDAITGAEALLRWEHPSMGWLDPELVVELAELSGLIQPLARFVAREAMAVAGNWLQHGHELGIAINLSARNLYDRNLVAWLQDTMRAMGLPTHLLKCELTESEVMDDPVLALDVITRLRDIGVHTAIDDFGTGYSSLSYLRRLPVDEIKIDKSFVLSMLDDRHDMTIVRTVIDLAHNLDMVVLAEGVEDQPTLDKLREFGCDRVQGFLVGRPMPDQDFWQLLPPRSATLGR